MRCTDSSSKKDKSLASPLISLCNVEEFIGSQEAHNMGNKDFCKAFNRQVVGRGLELSTQAGLTGRGNKRRGRMPGAMVRCLCAHAHS
jgi:hypothetical protein